MGHPIRIIIADHNQAFAQGLKHFLDQQADTHVVEIVRDGAGAIEACKEALPDVVIIDLHLPVVDSIKTIQSVLTQNERIKILAISDQPHERYAVEAVKAGARGYVDKNGQATHQRLAEAVRQIAGGEVVVNSTLAASILQEFS